MATNFTLEFGGKLLYDFHAARVLPGYDPNVKMRLLAELKDKAEVAGAEGGELPGTHVADLDAFNGHGSLGDRFNMLDTSWQIFKKHPVIGNGINTFFKNFMEMRNDRWKGEKGSYGHNCYLQMAADVGIVGLAGFLFLIFSYFRSVVRSLKVIKDPFFNSILWGISIGVFAFLVHSFFDTNLYSLNLATLFWTALGISQGIIRYGNEGERAA